MSLSPTNRCSSERASARRSAQLQVSNKSGSHNESGHEARSYLRTSPWRTVRVNVALLAYRDIFAETRLLRLRFVEPKVQGIKMVSQVSKCCFEVVKLSEPDAAPHRSFRFRLSSPAGSANTIGFIEIDSSAEPESRYVDKKIGVGR
jgi:hypothetical protein